MDTINIGSNQYEVYKDLNYVDEYLAGASHAGNYRDETDEDTKGRWAVTATRLIDRQYWKGSKSVSTQDHAFPRTGMGVTGVADDTTPDNVLFAYCELISDLADGSSVQTDENQSQKIQSMKAGSASLTYFRGAEGDPKRWPQIIFELLRDYLSAPSSTLDSASSSGTDADSVTDEDYSYSNPL